MTKVKPLIMFFIGFGLILSAGTCPNVSWAQDTCLENVNTPPFLSQGVDPNLLLMIDNSASMYDLAYVDPDSICYDDSFGNTIYAGYFENDQLYAYNFNLNKFVKISSYSSGGSGTLYSSGDVVKIRIDDSSTPKVVTVFEASGNFLNWVAASKLDIQKKILTGGKYDSANSQLVMESRGCMGSRFIKKQPLTDAAGNPYYLTLAARPPDDEELAAEPNSNTTRIEIFDVTTTGFEADACYAAVANLSSGDESKLGDLYGQIDTCMDYTNNSDKEIKDRMATFNHSLQNCWYLSKHGYWQNGESDIQNAKNDCEKVYTAIDPWLITPDDRGYLCSGDNDPKEGYVGRCWNPVTQDWFSNGDASVANCVDKALKDYCGWLDLPQVVDPSDQMSIATDITTTMWNAPAVLIDSGVLAQMGKSLLPILKGQIQQTTAPTGLIQEYANDIRMGAMIFNVDGSASECTPITPDSPPYVLLGCVENTKDGGKVISYVVDQDATHTNELVDAINGIKADSWTPVAEAMYNAIGYYTQGALTESQPDLLRLDSLDFLMDSSHPDPCTAWCQQNNVLIITEGASTADLNQSVQDFVNAQTGVTSTYDCNVLSGSTLLDDLTYYAKTEHGIFTHIVVAGSLRHVDNPLYPECSPDTLLTNAATKGGTTLYQASNPAELEARLREAFNQIRQGVASGSAASVISASRGGEGALYQAIFWPKVPSDDGSEVEWIGEVHALLTDSYGGLYEDTNMNKTLDSTDQQISIFYDEADGRSKVCYDTLEPNGTCSGTVKDLDEVSYLWSAADWLSSISSTDILENRSPYISDAKKRYIFTWEDLNNDGIAGSTEILDFVTRDDWETLHQAGRVGPVPLDFGVQTSDEVNNIVKWVRGLDQDGLRSRRIQRDTSISYWRLGDVIHSTPMAVARPAEGFQYLYRDTTYAQFANHYKNRRHVIYFGGNDGMLHAVNGGFYNEVQKKFCRTADCASDTNGPELGAELWAYVPYNLLSDLKCLTQIGYQHKYMVDLRPRTFDVQLWSTNDTKHIGGWGTILVVGMRFGGTRIQPGTLDLNGDNAADYPADTRQFASAYIIFDITDPESPPVLLGELTHTSATAMMGYTTVIPTVVVMRESDSNNPTIFTSNWYLILGSGPTDSYGRSTQNGKVAVFPLSQLVATTGAFRIPDAGPTSTSGGRFELGDANSFVSDMVTVDFELNPNYKSDAVYFGTVSGTWGSWGGKMYRLVTRKMDTDKQVSSTPDQWAGLLSPKVNPLPLIDAAQPVTATAAAGTDGSNFWIYFGTGRFYATDDKTDASQQSYYGIKEPMDCDGEFTWETVEKTGTHNSTPGAQGLLRVDQILVGQSSDNSTAALSCAQGGTGCLPVDETTTVNTFGELINYIAGPGCNDGDTTGTWGTDGWYRDFQDARERNLGQAALLGGLLTFTSYQPYDDVCEADGYGYLYGLYYQTGTAWRESVFDDGLMDDNNVISRLSLGRGMSTSPSLHVGQQEGSTAFVQTSTGTIVEIPQKNLPLKTGKTGRGSWSDRF